MMSESDLLKALEETNSTSSTKENEQVLDTTSYKNDILSFLSIFNIKPGKERIKKNVLYSIYRSWSNNPVSSKDFYIQMAKFIVEDKKSTKLYYINQNVIKITYEAFQMRKRKIAKVKSKNWGTKFQTYLDNNYIVPGDRWVHEEALYLMYKEINREKQPQSLLSRDHFIAFLKITFELKNTASGMFFAVNDRTAKYYNNEKMEQILKSYEKTIKKKQ